MHADTGDECKAGSVGLFSKACSQRVCGLDQAEPPPWSTITTSQTPSCNYSVSATADTVKLYHH